MNQNSQLKNEYFELSKLLNVSNPRPNQKTEISFFLGVENGSLSLFATTNKKINLRLIYQRTQFTWRPCGYSQFTNLEENLSKWAQKYHFENLNTSEITKLIKLLIFHDFEEH